MTTLTMFFVDYVLNAVDDDYNEDDDQDDVDVLCGIDNDHDDDDDNVDVHDDDT